MAFTQNHVLHLPELAERMGLTSPEFRVDGILRGGMGECIRVVQQEKSFALKVIQNDLVEHADAWNRYLREVRMWTTLSACDGVVEAFCVLRVNELPVVCSRWMPGGSLRRHLRNRSPEFFFSVMARIVGTLRWAHEHYKVIHRDLKPDNILLDEAGLAFVSDWGLARPLTASNPKAGHRVAAVQQSTHPALTAVGSFLGTVYYASPEQLLGEAALNQRADIYSLGCLMYEWEAGVCPFTGTTADEVRLKHLFQAPAALGGIFRKSTFGADDTIRACLEKDPEQRLPDYPSMDLALAEAAKQRGVRYEQFRPSLRYEMPMVGAGEYGRQVQSGGAGIRNEAGTYGVVELSDIERFLREGQVLAAVGDYSKAAEIYGSLFVPEIVTAVPDYPHNQHVAINYANCLIALGRADEAIKTLQCLAAAKEKPAEYFVNLSLAQISQRDHSAAASTASEGVRIYPGDQDLIGNLLTAQTAMGAFAQAAETAKARLTANRDVHSLHEVAALHCKYAASIRARDWPLAVKTLNYSVRLLREAKELNPRFLPVRLQLPIALEALKAYARCSDEIGTNHDLPLHVSDRVFLAYLVARCLDGAGAHERCWEFCDGWLKRIAEVATANPVPRHAGVRLERVRAVTVADGYCIGKMKDGQRVIAPVAAEFFARIVRDAELREAGDFCYLARLHEWMEEHEEAHAVLTQAESLYPEFWEIPFNRAAFRVRSGDYSGAVNSAERAAQLAPWKAQSWRLLAKALAGIRKVTEAESASRRAEEVQRVRDEIADEIEKT
jgi:serine/threonine protein kinase/Flp pilus assembly protein TadD